MMIKRSVLNADVLKYCPYRIPGQLNVTATLLELTNVLRAQQRFMIIALLNQSSSKVWKPRGSNCYLLKYVFIENIAEPHVRCYWSCGNPWILP